MPNTHKLLALTILIVVSTASFAQSATETALDSITPQNEAISVGQAGADPADIGRYLSARGAGAARLSPDGSRIAFSYSVTGAPQLWVIPAQGGQMRQLTFGNAEVIRAYLGHGRRHA